MMDPNKISDYEEEILAAGLSNMWRRVEEHEDRIRHILIYGPDRDTDANILQLLCAVALSQVAYKRKEWVKHETSS